MKARTPLTKSLNEQGCLIAVKKGNDRPELSDEDECVDTVDEERSRPLHKRELKWLKAKHYPGSYPDLREGNNRSREDQGARIADSALDTAKKSLGEADRKIRSEVDCYDKGQLNRGWQSLQSR